VLFSGIALLYLPILVLIGYSFNASPLVNVWGGFSTAWYGQLLHNRQLLEAALLSLEVAVAASSGAVVLGTLAATALVRFARFPGRLLLTGMVNAPLVMPEIITGITQLLLHRLRDHHRAGASRQRGPITRRGGHGSRRQPDASVPRDHSADHRAGDHLELAAVLHAVAR
jgi:ABC-type spermidine/putrescine transport system permease subunit II